ncbi:hypothetical protein CHS0354_026385 [Potamilus streckersoni]|uniref:Uncharacterized protein n=1 Tax=Potamilus streckersoni TaxID=2493646 RepID=A0AAE0T3C0_9BIVA|nr:hypothetical protein CHS0354_026385 [Potamilus streckersoni]
MSIKENKILVAAIDFGTTYSGYASVFRHEDFTKIIANSVWSSGSLLSLKCPTCVLFDPNGKFHSFGYEAENKYSELAQDNEHRKWYYFRRFKMTLCGKQIKREMEINDDKGLKMPARKIFGAAIKFLKKHLLDTLSTRGTGVAENDIHWVLTVPAIWSDAAKQFMREAAVNEAEIDSGSLTIALEPEAASLYCQLLPSDKLSASGRLTANKYMILDLGGGTADITVHEKQLNGSLKELHEPTGGPWGGTRVDEIFHQMLITIVGDKIFNTFCENSKEDHMDLLRELETKKRTITPELNGMVSIKMPVSLSSIYEKEKRETIEKALEKTHFKGKMTWSADKVRIEANLFRSLFEECTIGVTQRVRELLQKPELQNVDTFLMVGGFSESPLMQAAIKKAFPNAKVIIPAEAGLVVLKGAVVFGREPMIITSRIAKYTYGINISPPFDPSTHPQEKRVTIDGKDRCKDVFKKYIGKGESIKIGERRSGKHVSLKPGQQEMLLKIFASAEKDPRFVTDAGCECMGRLVVNLPEEQDIVKVNVDMMFGQTELLVEAEEEISKRKFTSYFDFL